MEYLLIIISIIVFSILYRRSHASKEEKDTTCQQQEFYENNQNNTVSEVNHIHIYEDKKGKKGKNRLVCPKCKSVNIQVIDNHRRRFSVKKAAVGGAVTVFSGGIGVFAGLLGGRNKKPTFGCNNCGHIFKKKIK